ncbi:tetratricopeptide repeat protein [Stieleria sp. ICT_E10.1]|uniref:ASPIC/UnbV domain-containing protein n=1 Tax=Stieleria sedimenti TaxID=2976331 RepID=UPI002180391E|nr:ASPIC/UnbV domain-containing protein [Stieleria sedimenti]MCS7465434.1 tetratricopeptide repeat protein [Stieleria sedimenti]
MTRIEPRHKNIWIWSLAILAIAVAAFFVVRRRPSDPDQADEPIVADAQTATGFYVSLAALDVEENERAAGVLDRLVKEQPNEPALWANLAVAKLRLNDLGAAEQALNAALAQLPRSRELLLLKAQLLKSTGQIPEAIETLRTVHADWPENIQVAFELSTLLDQPNTDAADQERLELLSKILRQNPENLRVRCECARLAATVSDKERLDRVIGSFDSLGQEWTPLQRSQLDQASKAASDGDYRQAAVALTFFENVVKPLPLYQQSLDELGILSVTAVGTPVRSLLALSMPPSGASPSDRALRFTSTEIFGKAARHDFTWAVKQPGERCSTLLSLTGDTLHIQESAALPFPGYTPDNARASLAWADLNYDFQNDVILVGQQGCRIFLSQPTGEYTALETDLELFERPWTGVWCTDIEADGDLDLLLSDGDAEVRCAINNGENQFQPFDTIPSVQGVIAVKEIDADLDGDVDLIHLDRQGHVAVWMNARGGKFDLEALDSIGACIAIAVTDLNANGRYEILCFTREGEIVSCEFDGQEWGIERNLQSDLSLETERDAAVSRSAGFLAAADLDNNGAIDVVASAAGQTQVWLHDIGGDWFPLPAAPKTQVTSVIDINCDGLLDLVGQTDAGTMIWKNESRAGYRWHSIQPKATRADGDKRINPFGIGGRIEIRAGNTVQSQMIDSTRIHFGLGKHSQIDVARIVWPNGTNQAEFELSENSSSVAVQRLKGSCPWVFTYDGSGFRFIKDFLWRSPLGLKINAQDTAGITQTEDRIKIGGDALAERNGEYEIRITAELWETHFFDHVSLLAIDHQRDTEIYVDESFVPQKAPRDQILVGSAPQRLLQLTDSNGDRVDEVLRENDGNYADHFPLGPYQGLTTEHWIEFSFPRDALNGGEILLVGHGWIYPTDSSLNVAISQNASLRPHGLVLEQLMADGSWKRLRDDLGFPAGKHKDMIIVLDSRSLSSESRYRLRTNMEVYWDSLRWSSRLTDQDVTQSQLALTDSQLLGRGFSKLEPFDRRRPDTPIYEVGSRAPQWLDLEGYYTRYGDVAELLQHVDDRYVIMNAGDELVLRFSAASSSPLATADRADGKRDFVLVGDGWVKDGDFNTSYSRTVRPLPSHSSIADVAPEYSRPLPPLTADPVYLKHEADWQVFHTRYVTPDAFQRKLMPHHQRFSPSSVP